MAFVFQLPTELNIYSVGATRDALLAWLAQDSSSREAVEIDASGVDEIDGAGIQLLGALIAALTDRGSAWSVKEPSVQVLEICRVLGSQSWLQRNDDAGVGL